jgi:Cysteine-rich secretory protein family
MTTAATRPSRSLRRLTVALATVISSAALIGLQAQPSAVRAGGVDPYNWLAVLNTYRAQSGVAPVSENGAWAAGTTNHSCWMLLNGIAHDEAPGTPGYSAEGDAAGNSSNVAVSSVAATTPKGHIDLWMSGPFHAIGILRSSLTQASYGQCASPPNPTATSWKSAATLDVIRGTSSTPNPSTPIVFPGNGATTSLTRFVAESPDPRSFCGWTGRSVGLPLIALMPSPLTSATATLTGPNGPVGTCVLTGANTSGVASSILGGDHAVVVVPDAPLVSGTYTVSVSSTAGAANWTFNVDPNAALAPPETLLTDTAILDVATAFESITPYRFADSRVGQAITRLRAGQQVRIQVAGQQGLPTDVTAISANFTIAEPSGDGYFTAFNCSSSQPQVSTLNFRAGEVIANQALVPLDAGALCVYSHTDADLIIDVNGYAARSANARFVPIDPKRLMDSRNSVPLEPGTVMRVVAAGNGSGVPAGSRAVALNLTAVDATGDGWIRVFPCDAAEPGVSNVNVRPGGVRANSVIVPAAADGSVCLTGNVTTHVIVDVTGWFGNTSGNSFIPLSPLRLADTRSYQASLNPAANAQPLVPGTVLRVQVAGSRGIPAGVRAASVNLVALDSQFSGWLRVVPCGTPSDVSNLNYLDPAPVANGANVKLSDDGAICVTASQTVHVIVDVNGVWI